MAKKLAQYIFALLTFFILSPGVSLAQTPTPTPVAHFEYLSKPLNYAADSVVSGNLAYVASGRDLVILDISDPANPSPVGQPYHVDNCDFVTVDVSEGVGFVAQALYSCSPRNSLFILDVSDPENPRKTGEEIPTGGSSGGASELDFEGGFVYLAFAQGGLRIIEIKETGVTGNVWSYTPQGVEFLDVKAIGNTLYLTDASRRIWLIDVSNKDVPDVLDTLTFPNHATGIDVSGNFAFVSIGAYLPAGNGGLAVVNISNPEDISQVGEITPLPSTEAAVDVEVEGNYAFVVDNRGKLFAFDISSPSHPSLVAEYQMQSEWKLTVSGDLILASNGFGGLVILRFTGLPPSAPVPFLDLPWDYLSKGKSFSEAATAINSYFDHEYPLLSAPSLQEPFDKQNQITTFEGERSTTKSYSSHDGYDYGTSAGATLGEPVLAAASGCAVYKHSNLGGNTILIDHGNRYQSRYLHLLNEGLVTTSTSCVEVQTGQQIGRVGFTGNVIPLGERGAHLHFMVVQDKNGDGNFDDNIPDGVVDPFGWQTKDYDDPWENYSFNYGSLARTGARSYYLWLTAIANLSPQLTSNGGLFALERYRVDFPSGSTDQTLNLEMRLSSLVRVSDSFESIGSSLVVTARDLFGSIVNGFLNYFTVSISFEGFDLSRYNQNTLAIYSSEDGVNWSLENTSIDFNNQIASANVNHLSHFVLMAERIDTISPATQVMLEGEEGSSDWFRSDVLVTLDAVDNDRGLGVDYTLYRVNDEDWQQYFSPVTFSQEGNYRIEFYSVDKDENIEDIKITEFNIDKSVPEAKIYYNLSLKKIVVEGIDDNETIVSEEVNGRMISVEDAAGNSITLLSRKVKTNHLKMLSISSIKYSDGLKVVPGVNKLHVFDNLNQYPEIFRFLLQSWFEKGEERLQIVYHPITNKSTILIKESGQSLKKEVRNGLVLLQIETDRGNLEVSY